GEEVRDLMNKAVLVTDLQTGHPPVLQIRLVAVADMNAPPATHPAFVAVIEILQPMQIVQVPEDRRVLAIDFESIKRLVTAGITRGFKRGEGTVAETREEKARVINTHFFHLASEGMLAFLDKGLRRCRDLVNGSVQPHRGVDAMSEQITGDAGARR